MTLTVVGRLTLDPEVRFLPDGTGVCDLVIAVNPREKTADGWKDAPASFVHVAAWGRLGENAAECLRRGMPVIAHGRWRQERWTDQATGEQRDRWRLTADHIGPDLRWTLATVRPAARNGGENGSGGTRPE